MRGLFSKKAECCGCGACAAVCPAHAVHMGQDREGFAYPNVDTSACIQCGRCREVCPIKNHAPKVCGNRYFGAKAKDKNVRYGSSSGGVFPILAKYVLERKGVVYGAGYDSNMRVVHRQARNLEELETIKRTKYVQSSLEGIFLRMERHLRAKRPVLFCGTPCQTRAVRLFFGQAFGSGYEGLILVDLVCYGVPSPGIWGDYVKYMERKRHGKMTDFSFRDKRARDSGHTCVSVISGREYAGSAYQDRFCRMYFANFNLRPSCYGCKFCTVDRDSDFTIGDFWGIGHVRPDMDDGMGNSVVLLHTDKAKEIWAQIRDRMDWFECKKEEILQPRLLKPSGRPKARGLFMALYAMLPFSLFVRLMDAAAGICGIFRAGMAVWKDIRGNFKGFTP